MTWEEQVVDTQVVDTLSRLLDGEVSEVVMYDRRGRKLEIRQVGGSALAGYSIVSLHVKPVDE